MPISRHTRNIRNSPSHSASITVWTSPPAASRARVSLIGNVTFLESRFAVDSGIQDCYLGRHPVSSHLIDIVSEVEHVQDARWWLPDDPDAAHTVRVLKFGAFQYNTDIYTLEGLLGKIRSTREKSRYPYLNQLTCADRASTSWAASESKCCNASPCQALVTFCWSVVSTTSVTFLYNSSKRLRW